ncbi:hypothetical protein MKK67_19990 [Methylobacterium sp. J-072]|uniref:hypothetical protein n=1 Tax=Methylobacterium sp. J-072 TaxID=2836651 RepID=UPI001FB94271|nr:hypothetical protein [Methylobacterium sp. J-072]MCJ2094760.1 hypothetical protein [Methylobacterium sp. J-072]
MVSQEAEIAALKILVTHILANLAMKEGSRKAAQDYIKSTNEHIQNVLSSTRDLSQPDRHKFIDDVQSVVSQVMSGYDFSSLPE